MTGRVSTTRTRFSAASVGVAYAVNWNSDPNSTQHFAPLLINRWRVINVSCSQGMVDVPDIRRLVLKKTFSALASTLNMGLINKVDMVCLSPVGYGV